MYIARNQHAILGILIAFLATIPLTHAQGLSIERSNDENIGVIDALQLIDGSSLTRESIVINHPNAPVRIQGHTTRLTFDDTSGRTVTLYYAGDTRLVAAQHITAINVRTALFDVFGRHIANLGNSDVEDQVSEFRLRGTWRANDNEALRYLTAVTFITHVRLADGTQWVYDLNAVSAAIAELNLQGNKAVDEEE